MENSRGPIRTYKNIMKSLGQGTVPTEGLGYIAVGREKELETLLRDMEDLADGGTSFRFIVGGYGSGKTFLLQTIKENAVKKKNMVVANVDLSPERGLLGNNTRKKGLATYKTLMENVSNKTNQSGHALRKILDEWVSKTISRAVVDYSEQRITELNPEEYSYQFMLKECDLFQDMKEGFAFFAALKLYWQGVRENDFDKKECALRWFYGQYANKQEVKKMTGISSMVDDENWFDIIKLWAKLFTLAGYSGFLVLIDELAYVYNTSSKTVRQKNYEKILSMYNDLLQGGATNLGIIMSGIPDSIYDKDKGLYSYEALRSRLSTGSYIGGDVVNMMTPIVKVIPLTKEETFILMEHLVYIHSQIYNYTSDISDDELLDFIKYAYMKRETIAITPRTMIRDFVNILDSHLQNKNEDWHSLITNYQFVADDQIEFEEVFD
ncbi:P-loop protein of unknown function [Pseudobutyrivibrio sp. 49]|uniref:ATP-binding protein n=1 Tax=unclassified Pseudobutyrivibrio TaxID=2638619 RepID=UPI000887EEBE|nr:MULTISPECIES: ATP-binding protein [unclassified Pseudobutyrivibrio]SDH83818.1 P-loop protein of unknown function [Pseudobutyrivibrio sp. 49]SFH57935.1 P-loop protein of unknown function [Pseudobutyrivibrio sp. OR37]